MLSIEAVLMVAAGIAKAVGANATQEGVLTALAAAGKLFDNRTTAAQRFGLENERAVQATCARILDAWSARATAYGDWAQNRDILRANDIIIEHVFEAMPSAAELGRLAIDPADSPSRAAEHIVDRIARRQGAELLAGPGIARDFATTVMREALTEALADPRYAERIFQHAVLAIAGLVARMDEKLNEVAAILRAMQATPGAIEPALRTALAQYIAFNPYAPSDQVAAMFATWAARYEALKFKVASIEAQDNHLAALKADAEAALQRSDLDAARESLGEVARLTAKHVEGAVRTAGEALVALAQADFMAFDWRTADQHFTEAEILYRTWQPDEADKLAVYAAEAFQESGDRLGNIELLVTARTRWKQLARPLYDRDARFIAVAQHCLGNTIATIAHIQEDVSAGLEALPYLNNALEYWMAISDHDEIARTSNSIGNVFSAQREWQKAVDIYLRVLTYWTESSAPELYGMTMCNLGQAYKGLAVSQSDATYFEQSIVCMSIALKVRKRLGFMFNTATNALVLANTYYLRALMGLSDNYTFDVVKALNLFDYCIPVLDRFRGERALAGARANRQAVVAMLNN